MNKVKSEPNLVTYLHRKGRQLGLPISGNFELTSRCNFNCPMCYVHSKENDKNCIKSELTAQQWLKIAKDAKDRGMVFALLTGGEPLIRKDFFDIYYGMQEMGIVISINTNGSLLKGEILEKFLENPPFRFNISLYGGSNDTYRDMCGIGAYDDVKESIRALRNAGVEVSLNLSITPYNHHDLERIYNDAKELNVNVRASSYMYPSIRVNGDQYGCGNRFSPKEAAEAIVKWDKLRFSEEEFKARAEHLANFMQESSDGCPVEVEEGVKCRAGSSSFWMTWDGRMLPCGIMTEPIAYPLETGFNEAWDSILKQTADIRTPAKCSACQYKNVCGVCAAVCYTETGSFDQVPEFMCNHIIEKIKIMKNNI